MVLKTGLDDSLNTASVLIQLLRDAPIGDMRVFKYSICSYSTLYTAANYDEFLGLNTASVLIQRWKQ